MKKKKILTEKQIKNRNRIKLLLKFLLVVGILTFMVQKGYISLAALRQAFQEWPKLLPGVLGLFFTMILGVFRWQWLLRAQNIHLTWFRTLQLTLIGNFFNISLPGAVTGDFVKAFYIGQEMKGQRSKAFGSILFDRVAGLSALVMVSAVALSLQFKKYVNQPLMSAVGFMITAAAVCVVLFYGYLFFVKEKHDVLLIALRKMEKKYPFLGSIVRVYESLRHYHHHRGVIIKVLLLSCMIHLTVGWSCLKFGMALDQTSLSLSAVYIIVPLGLLITAVPIGPAGVGTGNAAFWYLFGVIGSQRGADIYSLYAMSQIMIGLLGAMVYFQFRGKHQIAKV